jgi:perosamine synthetase
MEKLALFGGSPVISSPFRKYNTLDQSDFDVVQSVIASGNLSNFIGDLGPNFLGGHEVRLFEANIEEKFGVKHAITVNSWTSGLWAAIGSFGFDPGSEIITSSWGMVASATTILHWNLIPVFADIDPRTFNLDPVDVEEKITKRTRAIVCPDIFGQSADIESLLDICKKYDLKLLSDSAQSPLSKRHDYYAGTGSHIGGYSFNYHKHIHTGEGGVVVTNDSKLAERVQLLRNHGEVIISKRTNPQPDYGILGMNIRMGEIEAALGRNQLTKLENAVLTRQMAAQYFTSGIKNLNGLIPPYIDSDNEHVYYVYGMKLDFADRKIDRELLLLALRSEGVPSLMSGYQNIHKISLFKNQLTNKNNPIPYNLLSKKRRKILMRQELPISEKLHNKTFIGINWCAHTYTQAEVDLLVCAFNKVWANLDQLKNLT